jgi:uncharacterized membrane protein YgaE (UPF0421/DUF939 family)
MSVLNCKLCNCDFEERVKITTIPPLPDYQVEYYKKKLFSSYCSDCSVKLVDLKIEEDRLKWLNDTLKGLKKEIQYYQKQREIIQKNINDMQLEIPSECWHK